MIYSNSGEPPSRWPSLSRVRNLVPWFGSSYSLSQSIVEQNNLPLVERTAIGHQSNQRSSSAENCSGTSLGEPLQASSLLRFQKNLESTQPLKSCLSNRPKSKSLQFSTTPIRRGLPPKRNYSEDEPNSEITLEIQTPQRQQKIKMGHQRSQQTPKADRPSKPSFKERAQSLIQSLQLHETSSGL